MKTIAQVYLRMTFDDIDPQIVSDCLKLKPSRQYKKGDPIKRNPSGNPNIRIDETMPPRYKDHTGWSYEPDKEEETTDISIQTRKLMKVFEPKINDILTIQQQFDTWITIIFYLQFYENMNPAFKLEKDFVNFAHEINAHLDIDMYYYNNMGAELPDIWDVEGSDTWEERKIIRQPTIEAALHILGDDFNPQYVTDCLELKPTSHYKKVNPGNGEPSQYRSNSAWVYELDIKETWDVGERAEKLAEIFRPKINELLAIQQTLNSKILIKLHAHVWDETAPGLVLEKEFIAFASAINADVDIGVYLH